MRFGKKSFSERRKYLSSIRKFEEIARGYDDMGLRVDQDDLTRMRDLLLDARSTGLPTRRHYKWLRAIERTIPAGKAELFRGAAFDIAYEEVPPRVDTSWRKAQLLSGTKRTTLSEKYMGGKE